MKNFQFVRWLRPRFSLKTLLIAFTIFAIFMGTLGVHLQHARQQRLAVAALRAAGEQVWYESKYMMRHGPNVLGWTPSTLEERWQEWVALRFGKDAAYQVHRVFLHRTPPSEEALKDVQKLSWLKELHVQIQTILSDEEVEPSFSNEAWRALLKCNQIEKLTLKRDQFNPRRLVGLSDLSQLRHLVIDGGELTSGDTNEITRLKNLTHLELSLVATTDEALQPLSKLNSLETFHLKHSGLGEHVTDHGLEFLANLPALRSLAIARLPPVTDRIFTSIESLTQLESLNLDQASIRGTEIRRLRKLPNLKHLNLIGTKVDSKALQQIASLTQLESLNLLGTQVTDEGIKHLSGLHNLRKLSLGMTDITDASIEHLVDLPHLGELLLGRTELTDASIEHLIRIRSLRSLWLGETKISNKGKAILKQQLPDCSIDWH